MAPGPRAYAHEPQSKNLMQGKTICLDILAVKVFSKRVLNRNGCAT